MFSDKDIKQIETKGLTVEKVNEQISVFKKGFPYAQIIRGAVKGDGIKVLSDSEKENYINKYESITKNNQFLKFVPASGAASRMFKNLFAFISEYQKEDYTAFSKKEKFEDVYDFFKSLENFAFYEDLSQTLENEGLHIAEIQLKQEYKTILKALLTEEGLNYGNLPKGLLKFHKYPEGPRTPVEEHMVEGCNYAANQDGTVAIHFTVSPEHQQNFEEHVAKVAPVYEKKYGKKISVTYSVQKPSTDTIGVTPENEPFRNPDGTILFRPGGHGALIENLGELDADIIIIKNIDNVTHDRFKQETFDYKKVLTGVLDDYKERIHNYMHLLKGDKVSGSVISEISDFLKEELCIEPRGKNENREEAIAYFKRKLNRPIRVCGMVKAEGDTGGGPFWVKNSDGTTSLQIVESAQIDLKDPFFKEIYDQATHFNPVDIACCIKDYKNRKFDLKDFVDYDAGFISNKSKDGKDLKALELPGLWNGSMANWISIFVEVPLITFNPVKKVNDLLKDTHQPS